MATKSELWKELKERGIVPEREYVYYTTDQLADLLETGVPGEIPETTPASPVAPSQPNEVDPYLGDTPLPVAPERPARVQSASPARREPQTIEELLQMVVQLFQEGRLREGLSFSYKGYQIPVQDQGADRAGLTYSHPVDIPIRIDLHARIWFMDEVQKPAIPKARMVRKTRSIDRGVKQLRTTRENGATDEIIEVAGDEHRELTTSVTLPSWQVGKYRDARFPFAIHSYNGQTGFDYLEVVRYFGGYDLVPGTIKVLYVGNQMCYHIPSTRDTIQNQFHLLQRTA